MTDRRCAATRPPTVPEVLAARAAERPGQVAILHDGIRPLTLADWQVRSARAARGLSRIGVAPGDRVGLVFGDDGWIEYAVGYCAVLAAGAVAVPLPADLPTGRIRERLDHCAASAVVHAAGLDVTGLGRPGATVPDLEDGPAVPDHWAGPSGRSGARAPSGLAGATCPAGSAGSAGGTGTRPAHQAADRLAEIVYLRGGGPPRAVAATHGDITTENRHTDDATPFGTSGPVLCGVRLGTRTGQWVLAKALAGRGTAVTVPDPKCDRVDHLVGVMRPGAVLLEPATAVELLDAGIHLRHDTTMVRWAASGDAPLSPSGVHALRTVFANATLVDHYEPATAPVPVSVRMLVDTNRPGSLGRPMDGNQLMIAGADGAPLPPGRVGEVLLCPSTPTRGYPPDPGGDANGREWIRLGDRGYLDADGYLHLVGRPVEVIRTGGVKVSAPRVRAALAEHPAVTEAAVVGLRHPVLGETVAAAVVTSQDVGPADLRHFVSGRLAEHEVPTRILVVGDLPRDGAGVATDRVRDLLAAGEAPRMPPASPVETALAEQWTAVLGVPVTGVDDDFFALGGDSLKAALLAARVERTFGVRVSASLVFDVPVFGNQAGWLAARTLSARRSGVRTPSTDGPGPGPGRGPTSTLAQGPATRPVNGLVDEMDAGWAAPRAGGAPGAPGLDPARPPLAQTDWDREDRAVVRVPLSPFQERTLRWMFGGSRPRRMLPVVTALRIAERLDLRTMRRSLNEIAYRHESLRTVFAPVDHGYEALTLPDTLPNFVSIRARGGTLAEREEHARRLAREYLERPFDIVRGPLFRALVIQLGEDDNVLILSVDRLVSDGLSIEVLLEELGVVYAAYRAGRRSPLPPVELRCSEFLAWVHAQYDHNRGYWERELAGAPPAVGPLPGQNTATRTYSNCRYDFAVPDSLRDRLRGAYARYGVTAFMASIAAWSGVLAGWTGSGEVVLSAPMSGRTRPEFESLVGSILQSPFFRLRTTGDPTFGELFTQARQSVVAATEHQFYPHHELLSRVPYPACVAVDDRVRQPRLPGLDCTPFRIAEVGVPDWPLDSDETDLTIPRLGLAAQPDGSMTGTLTYNRCAFERDVVERLARDFLRFAGAALEDSGRRLSDLPVSVG